MSWALELHRNYFAFALVGLGAVLCMVIIPNGALAARVAAVRTGRAAFGD